MFCVCPAVSGVEMTQVVAMDPAGMIPSFIKTKIATRMASGPMIMVDYLANGVIPEPAF